MGNSTVRGTEINLGLEEPMVWETKVTLGLRDPMVCPGLGGPCDVGDGGHLGVGGPHCVLTDVTPELGDTVV